MSRVCMTIEYDGTEFHGWQIQPDRPSVQETLEKGIFTVLGEKVRVEAAGRTDAGVHAKGQMAAFTARFLPDPGSLQKSLNALCRPGIAIRELREVSVDFDPRRHAIARTYEYRIRNHPAPSPFSRRYTWHVREPLDVAAMCEAAHALLGEHDFSSFQSADCDAENPVRRIDQCDVRREGDDIVLTVRATAFLRHMVRSIIGTLVEVGRGERTPESLGTLLQARDRRLAGATAPPHGLCLLRVHYLPGAFHEGNGRHAALPVHDDRETR